METIACAVNTLKISRNPPRLLAAHCLTSCAHIHVWPWQILLDIFFVHHKKLRNRIIVDNLPEIRCLIKIIKNFRFPVRGLIHIWKFNKILNKYINIERKPEEFSWEFTKQTRDYLDSWASRLLYDILYWKLFPRSRFWFQVIW